MSYEYAEDFQKCFIQFKPSATDRDLEEVAQLFDSSNIAFVICCDFCGKRRVHDNIRVVCEKCGATQVDYCRECFDAGIPVEEHFHCVPARKPDE